MKTKLFSFFIAVFLLSTSGNAQCFSTTTPPVQVPCITLIGSGNGGWTDTAETEMRTADGITYTLVDKVLTTGEVKFREGKCWETGCAGVVPTVTNTFGWGPVKAVAPAVQDTGWPSGTVAAPAQGAPNIQSQAGSWTITFNRIAGSWSFVAGTPLPVIKVVGTGVVAAGGAVLTTADGKIFTAKKVALQPGAIKIDIDGTSYGSAVAPGFPTGTADSPTGSMTVTTTGIDYDVTFDYSKAEYTFAVATFPIIDIIGNGTTGTEAGWGLPQVLATTDGETYTIKNLKLYATSSDSNPPGAGAGVKFRLNNSWDTNWGGNSFPTGPTGNNDNIMVNAGTYNVTFNRLTGAYAFSFPIVDIIGNGTTGNESGWTSGTDMATVDGVNYTITRTLFATSSDSNPPGGAAGVKFRLNKSWDINWGGTAFPVGPTQGNNDNIMVSAGTYAIKFNRETGAYDFGSTLSVKNFNAGSFKVYPNPTKESWNITSNDDITSVQVYDMLGKSVYAKGASSKEVTVSGTELSKGVYFAKISTANGSSTVKLIKE